jgi:hypothetical protein
MVEMILIKAVIDRWLSRSTWRRPTKKEIRELSLRFNQANKEINELKIGLENQIRSLESAIETLKGVTMGKDNYRVTENISSFNSPIMTSMIVDHGVEYTFKLRVPNGR